MPQLDEEFATGFVHRTGHVLPAGHLVGMMDARRILEGGRHRRDIGGFGDDGGTSGLVDVFNSSDVITSGETAHGIFAQSVGGGGGSGPISGGCHGNCGGGKVRVGELEQM